MDDNRRCYSLDALRGSMMMLGIVLHGSQWYISEPPGGLPVPTDPSTAYVFDVIVHFIHSFRMPLFFVLAGFFTSLLVQKRGLRGTYANRGSRILSPLLVSCLTILPLTMLAMIAFMGSAKFNTFQVLPSMEQINILKAEISAAGMPVDQPSLGHLWFLYYLLYFYLLIPLCMGLVWLLKKVDADVGKVIASPLLYIPLVMYSAATLWAFRGGVLFEGFLFIKPHLPALLYYGSFFVFGYVFHNFRQILVTFNHSLNGFLGISVILLPLAIMATASEFAMADVDPQTHAVAVALNACLTWSLIYLFMGLFLRFLDYKSPWILYISNSSYWVYLIHMPIVTTIAWLLLPFDLPALIKFPIVVLVTTLICFSSYHYWILDSWVSQLLNGVRFNHAWPWQENAASNVAK